jgi:hypothetical protein
MQEACQTMEKESKSFRGFAIFNVGALRAGNFDVKDSRNIFCGHADLELGVMNTVREEGEPAADQSVNIALEDVCRDLMNLCNFHLDSQATQSGWNSVTGSI